MSAAEIMREIAALPAAEQSEVVRFACQLEASRQLTGGELASLAERLAAAGSPSEAEALRAAIIRGFYGTDVHA